MKVEVRKEQDGKWRFTVAGPDGKLIIPQPGTESHEECGKELALLQKLLPTAQVIYAGEEKKTTKPRDRSCEDK